MVMHQHDPELCVVAVTMFHGVLMGSTCSGYFSKEFFSLIDGTRETLKPELFQL